MNVNVELTEEQTRALRNLLESNLSIQLGEGNRAFIRRILTKLDKSLAKAKTQDNS